MQIHESKTLKLGYKQTTGKQAEQLAADYLCRQGLCLIQRNYRCTRGEIDLIMFDQQTSQQQAIVFVEVRYRKTERFVTPEETVNISKQQKILTAAQYFLCSYGDYDSVRFDLVSITGDLMSAPKIRWIAAAFESRE